MRNTILSWRVFYPLSKLAYLTLLIVEPLSIAIFASLHRPIYLTTGSTVCSRGRKTSKQSTRAICFSDSHMRWLRPRRVYCRVRTRHRHRSAKSSSARRLSSSASPAIDDSFLCLCSRLHKVLPPQMTMLIANAHWPTCFRLKVLKLFYIANSAHTNNANREKPD